jgi:hypothetical protein
VHVSEPELRVVSIQDPELGEDLRPFRRRRRLNDIRVLGDLCFIILLFQSPKTALDVAGRSAAKLAEHASRPRTVTRASQSAIIHDFARVPCRL